MNRTRRLLGGLALVTAAAFIAWVPHARADQPTIQANDRILGDPKAPITIFEYASLTCPHCAAFEADTLPEVKDKWIDTGKAKLVYRDYPLDDSAVLAATVARCLPPESFFPFIETLFETQHQWVYRDSADTKLALSHTARLAGMGPDQFNQCVNNQKNADAVVASRLVAQNRYGVDSTPTFFINGVKVAGDILYSEFVKYLNLTSGQNGVPAEAAARGESLIDRIKSWFGS
jgi:protein-disulfide isomerase